MQKSKGAIYCAVCGKVRAVANQREYWDGGCILVWLVTYIESFRVLGLLGGVNERAGGDSSES